MQKSLFIITIIVLFVFTEYSKAQIKITDKNPFSNSTPPINPSVTLELESDTKGFIIPRVANVNAISHPLLGMIVYVLDKKGFAVYAKNPNTGSNEWTGYL